MIICAAQFRPVAGDIAANTTKHLQLIDVAVGEGAGMIYFPELSLTGYEPRLARSLAADEADPRLDVFQQQSGAHNVIIGVGLPLSSGPHVEIGMVWFSPGKPRLRYAKQRLHADELPFFVQGDRQLVLQAAGDTLAPAICYESLQPSHADDAARLGANVYLASAAKPARALAQAMLHYPAVARKYNMYVLMADCVGPSDDFVSVGQSAAWNNRGELLAQMDAESEGMVLVDTLSGNASVRKA
jgi:predicted amidohydrolase